MDELYAIDCSVAQLPSTRCQVCAPHRSSCICTHAFDSRVPGASQMCVTARRVTTMFGQGICANVVQDLLSVTVGAGRFRLAYNCRLVDFVLPRCVTTPLCSYLPRFSSALTTLFQVVHRCETVFLRFSRDVRAEDLRERCSRLSSASIRANDLRAALPLPPVSTSTTSSCPSARQPIGLCTGGVLTRTPSCLRRRPCRTSARASRYSSDVCSRCLTHCTAPSPLVATACSMSAAWPHTCEWSLLCSINIALTGF